MADGVLADNGQHLLMQHLELRAQGIAGSEHRPGNLLQHRLAVDEFVHVGFKSRPGHNSELAHEVPHYAADAQLQIKRFGVQLIAGNQKGADLLRRQGSAMDQAVQPMRTI